MVRFSKQADEIRIFPLTHEDIDSAVDVVAQMGPEPFIRAHEEENPDIIVAGRAYDPSPFAAFCMNLGVERAPAFHLGKILECGGQYDFLENQVRNYTRGLFPELDKSDECRLIIHVYGRNAIMGPLEPNSEPAHEVGVLGEVVAPTAAKAMAICNSARVSCLHLYHPGILATTGNFASPLSPHEQDAGAVFKFSLYHLMEIDDPTDPTIFPIKSSTAGTGTFVKDENFGKQFFNLDNFLSISPEEIKTKSVPTGPATMRDVASVVRSKNSGPFELTFDIMFDDEKHYQRVKRANVLTNETIKKLYLIRDEDIVINMNFDPALA
ncbi:hypothetical protein CGCVW01_v010275 [Colletotrichum viniferum]|nr:hypothetical protein CGCVW01_v010275 [Colletotrichum viniferum]